jgi:exopolysaccharide production protein ExoY
LKHEIHFESISGEHNSVSILRHNRTRYLYLLYGKRLFDVLLASLMLIFLAPVLVISAFLTSLDGESALFSHERVGLDGRRFKCLKFRTMCPNSEAILHELLSEDPEIAKEWSQNFKLSNDPRITGIGNWLRRTSLDELPQLLNVIRGDMSLVGPRPITEPEMVNYRDHITEYLSLRPGLTGIWQVHGRGHVGYEERVKMDVRYFMTASFAGDLKLLLLTVLVVFKRGGQ